MMGRNNTGGGKNLGALITQGQDHLFSLGMILLCASASPTHIPNLKSQPSFISDITSLN